MSRPIRPHTPENQQSLSCDSRHGRTTDLIRKTRRKYRNALEGEQSLIPICHQIDENFSIGNQHQFLQLDTELPDNKDLHETKNNFKHFPIGVHWLINIWSFLGSLLVMVIRGLLTRCFSRVNVTGMLMFLFLTILSALFCCHNITKNAVQAPVDNKVPSEDTSTKDTRLEIDYVAQDKIVEQIAQYQKNIEQLKQDVKLIHERHKKSEINLIKRVHLGFQALKTNNNLELKREIEQYQQVITKKLIQQELDTYDADKIGIADFALDALGGKIIGTIDTEQYIMHHVDLWIYKFPLNTGKHSPRNIIQPWAEIGNCWAFVGSTGKVVIELATLVQIKGFTMEHISPKITLFGTIDSAPKEFTVLGMNGPEVKDNEEPESLGTYQYNTNGQQRQTFWGKVSTNIPYRFILLWIRSNHGNPKMTCVHRFRVHGDPVPIDNQL